LLKGLDLFQEHLGQLNDCFVIIGGAACSMNLGEKNLPFRQTDDLDIVIQIEAIDKRFYHAFRDFLLKGKYRNLKSSGEKIHYRFDLPLPEYPEIIELFSRKPDKVESGLGKEITFIPIPEETSNLSAILMDDEYYELVVNGWKIIDGLPVLSAEYLMPLKAHAYRNLVRDKKDGKKVDSIDIKKHKNDIFRLSQLLSADQRVDLSVSVASELDKCLNEITPFDPKTIGVNDTFENVISGLRSNYKII